MALPKCSVQEQHLGRNYRQLELLTTHVRKMDNVAVYQNGVYIHNINKFFTRVTSNTIDDILLETEYTS